MITMKQIFFQNIDIMSIFLVLIFLIYFYKLSCKKSLALCYFTNNDSSKTGIIFKIRYFTLIIALFLVLGISQGSVANCMEAPVPVLTSQTDLTQLFGFFLAQSDNDPFLAFRLLIETVFSIQNFPHLLATNLNISNNLSLIEKFRIYLEIFRELKKFEILYTDVINIYNSFVENNVIENFSLSLILPYFLEKFYPILKNIVYLNSVFFNTAVIVMPPLDNLLDSFLGRHITEFIFPTYSQFRSTSLLIYVELVEHLKLVTTLIVNLQTGLGVDSALIQTGATSLSEANFRTVNFLASNNWNTSQGFRLIYNQFININNNIDFMTFIQNYVIYYSDRTYSDIFINFVNYSPEELIGDVQRMRSVPRLRELSEYVTLHIEYINPEISGNVFQQIDGRINHLEQLHTRSDVVSIYNLRPR